MYALPGNRRNMGFDMQTIRTRFFPPVVLAGIVLVYAAGCMGGGDTGTIDEKVYASVNGVHLTESELRSIVPAEFYDRLTSEHKELIVDDWIHNELLYQEALSEGIDQEPDIMHLISRSEQQLLRNELLERRLNNIPEPTGAELERYYEDIADLFVIPTTEYRVRYALFDNQNDANDFHRKVKQNASFSDLSREMSKDPSSANGGDIGVVNEDVVDPAIWESIIATKKKYDLHRISDPFKLTDGWGCVIIDEQYNAGTIKPFEYVRDQVLDLYMTEKREEEKQAFIEQLADNAAIERYTQTR